MKTKTLIQLFLLAFVSLSLYSCTADTVNETVQKNSVLPKVTTPIADYGTTVIEPNLTNPR